MSTSLSTAQTYEYERASKDLHGDPGPTSTVQPRVFKLVNHYRKRLSAVILIKEVNIFIKKAGRFEDILHYSRKRFKSGTEKKQMKINDENVLHVRLQARRHTSFVLTSRCTALSIKHDR